MALPTTADEIWPHIEKWPFAVIRIKPVGRFVTYGIGVPMIKMRHPDESLARVPVG